MNSHRGLSRIRGLLGRVDNTMYELITIQEFSAAHRLRGYEGKCERLHGHNWKVEVRVCAHVLDERGLAKDFAELKAMTARVLDDLDHSDLTTLAAFADTNPSAENLSRHIYERIKRELAGSSVQLQKVVVWESDTAGAAYTEDRNA